MRVSYRANEMLFSESSNVLNGFNKFKYLINHISARRSKVEAQIWRTNLAICSETNEAISLLKRFNCRTFQVFKSDSISKTYWINT